MININRLNTNSSDFVKELERLLAWEQTTDSEVVTTVTAILDDVRRRGDEALLEYTRQFDRVEVANAAALELSGDDLRAALAAIDDDHRQALEAAAARVRAYAEHQRIESWS